MSERRVTGVNVSEMTRMMPLEGPTTGCRWEHPPVGLCVTSNEVHVWRAKLDLDAECLAALTQILATVEMAQAARFRFAQHGKRFIAARGLLRAILARYVGTTPADLRFAHTAYGKPLLVGGVGLAPVDFNMAHSEGLALYAIARNRAVGIDLEATSHDIEQEPIVEQFFAAEERRALSALPAAMQYEAFLRCWVRKEAYVKARGEGLAYGLSRFCVSLSPGEPAQLLWAADGPAEVQRWLLRDLALAPGYVGSLAAEGQDWSLSCYHCPEALLCAGLT